MLPIVFAFSATSPFIRQHRITIACGSCIRTLLQVVLATVVTAGIYGLALLAQVTLYAQGVPMADLWYCLAFALATLLAVCGGSLVSPPWFGRLFAPAAGAAAAFFPAYLYVHHGLTGEWRAIFLWYVAGSVAGSFAAAKLVSQVARHGRAPVAFRTA